jgi:hypothetical protein
MSPRTLRAPAAPRRRAALVLAGALAACATAPPVPESLFELEAFRWRGDARGASEIVAVNRWGDLRVRTTRRDELVVGAMIQRLGTRRDELVVRVDERADAIVVEIVAAVARPHGRVDLTLIVPEGKRLRATTRDGLAEVKYRGDVDVRTRSGDVTIETAGHARARSDTGAIVAKLTRGDWRRQPSFASGRGDVTVWLPDDAELRPHAVSRRGAVRFVPYARPTLGG